MLNMAGGMHSAASSSSSPCSLLLLAILTLLLVSGTVPELLQSNLDTLKGGALRAVCLDHSDCSTRSWKHQNAHHLGADGASELNELLADISQTLDGGSVGVHQLQQDLHDVHPEVCQLLLPLDVVAKADGHLALSQ